MDWIPSLHIRVLLLGSAWLKRSSVSPVRDRTSGVRPKCNTIHANHLQHAEQCPFRQSRQSPYRWVPRPVIFLGAKLDWKRHPGCTQKPGGTGTYGATSILISYQALFSMFYVSFFGFRPLLWVSMRNLMMIPCWNASSTWLMLLRSTCAPTFHIHWTFVTRWATFVSCILKVSEKRLYL